MKVDIVCPKCETKAVYVPESWTDTYRLYPSKFGQVKCVNCGLNKPFEFTNDLYYFKVPFGDRYLFARSVSDLELLRDYFSMDKTSDGDPDLDFPKVFYKNREELVKRINKRLEKEVKATNKT